MLTTTTLLVSSHTVLTFIARSFQCGLLSYPSMSRAAKVHESAAASLSTYANSISAGNR